MIQVHGREMATVNLDDIKKNDRGGSAGSIYKKAKRTCGEREAVTKKKKKE